MEGIHFLKKIYLFHYLENLNSGECHIPEMGGGNMAQSATLLSKLLPTPAIPNVVGHDPS